jgi:hypothetical protein
MSIWAFTRRHFWNRKREHPKIGFVTIMLSKRIFDPEKLWLNFFEGGGGGCNQGVKLDP